LTDKVVLVTDLRSGLDCYKHPDGRELASCYGHAAGIEALLAATTAYRLGAVTEYAVIILGGVLGLLAAFAAVGRPRRRVAILAPMAAALIAASLIAYQAGQYLCNPLVPIFAMVLTSELTAGVFRTQAVRN
jgi:CHASE2 domain-containing sensor protein